MEPQVASEKYFDATNTLYIQLLLLKQPISPKTALQKWQSTEQEVKRETAYGRGELGCVRVCVCMCTCEHDGQAIIKEHAKRHLETATLAQVQLADPFLQLPLPPTD